MKYLVFLIVFLISSQILAQRNNKLFCKVQNGSFIVINNEGKTVKRFIQKTSSALYKCEEEIAAAIIGNFFVTSDGDEIKTRKLSGKVNYNTSNLLVGKSIAATINDSRFITSNGLEFNSREFDDKYDQPEFIKLDAKDNIIGGMIGPVFVVSNGEEIKMRTFSRFTSDTLPLVSVSKDIVGVYWQDYIITSNFEDLKHRNLEDVQGEAKVVAIKNRFVVVHGNHLYLSDGENLKRKYFSGLQISQVPLMGEKKIIAAYIAPYFIAIDSTRFTINTKHIGREGALSLKDDLAIYVTDGAIYTYSASSGQFRKKSTR